MRINDFEIIKSINNKSIISVDAVRIILQDNVHGVMFIQTYERTYRSILNKKSTKAQKAWKQRNVLGRVKVKKM
jgi:hypothetical protein